MKNHEHIRSLKVKELAKMLIRSEEINEGEEIDRIVRHEIGDGCEISQMILKAIRGKNK